MRDGALLSTDIYFPSEDGANPVRGQFPALLQRTPYNKRNADNVSQAEYFAKRDYIAVVQDIRGRNESSGAGSSSGAYDGNGIEGPDGYDTVEWVAGQPWSNGKVGVWGFSYPSAMAYALLTLDSPHLKAFLGAGTGKNYWEQGIRYHGAFQMRFFHGAFLTGVIDETDPQARNAVMNALQNFDQWLDNWPYKRGETPLSPMVRGSKGGTVEEWYLTIVSRGDYPGPGNFWAHPGHRPEIYYASMPDIPMLHYTGWYETYSGIQDPFYTDLVKIKEQPQYLVISPRVHTIDFASTAAGDIDFGPGLADYYNQFILRWYDQWLRDIDTGIKDDPPVVLWIMGTGTGRKTAEGRLDVGGCWRFEKEWPLARTRYTNYYFHEDGTLKTGPPGIEISSTAYRYDPNNPVPSIGGCVSAFGEWLLPGGYNQVVTENIPRYVKGNRVLGPLSERDDVIVFQTPPLDRKVEITGPITVKLWVSPDCVDTDFTAKLVNVFPPNEDYPDGYALNVADGIVRASYGHGRTERELLVPGEVYEVEIKLGATGMIFQKGHRIRVDISSSNYPRFDLNPNTGEPLGLHRNVQTAVNTIFHDRLRPSHIILPLIPGSGDTEIKRGGSDLYDDTRHDGSWREYMIMHAVVYLSSGIFLAGRTACHVIKNDLEPLGFSLDDVELNIDCHNRVITVDGPHMRKRKVVYNRGQGSTIVPFGEDDVFFSPLKYEPGLPDPATLEWPAGDLTTPDPPPGVNVEAVESILDRVFQDKNERAWVIVHEGKIIGERYGEGFSKDTPHRSWSQGKSITAALLGILVGDGYHDLKAPAPVPGWHQPGDPRSAITIEHLLQMSSGLDFNRTLSPFPLEDFFGPRNHHNFIYFEGVNVFEFCINRPLAYKPGTNWRYLNCDTLSIGRIIRDTVEKHYAVDYLEFPQRALYDKIGIRTMVNEVDPYGNFITTGHNWAIARDWARFGLLHLQDGVWESERILPEGWVKCVTSPAAASAGYGGQFWLNRDGSFEHLPRDAYWAAGTYGQYTLIIPSFNLVIARLAWNPRTDFQAAVSEIIKAIKK